VTPIPPDTRRSAPARRLAGAFGWLLVAIVLLLPTRDLSDPLDSWIRSTGGALALVAAALLCRAAVRDRRRPVRRAELAAALGVVVFSVYLATGTLRSATDNFSNPRLAANLIEGRGLDMSSWWPSGSPPPYSLLRSGSALLPRYPLGTGLLSLPDYLVWRALGRWRETPSAIAVFERHSAALLAAASAALLFWGLASRLGARRSAALALLFALATSQWTGASQGLWSATGSSFALAIVVALGLRRQRGRFDGLGAGVAAGVAFLCRPSALLLGLSGAPLFLARGRASAVRYGAAALAAGLAVAALQFSIYGSPLGAYGRLQESQAGFSLHGMAAHLAGVLASPSRGFLIFLPLLLLALGARPPRGSLALAAARWTGLAALGSTTLLLAIFGRWWGGYCFGPRLFTDSSPLLVLLAVPAALRWRRLGTGQRWAWLAAAGIAIGLQLTALQRPVAWSWNEIVDVDHQPGVLWSLRNSQLAATVLPGWTFRPPPYQPDPGGVGSADPERLQPVDLAAVANARYDLRLFDPAPLAPGSRAYPRLDPARMNRPGALFRFLPRGRPNAVVLSANHPAVELAAPTGPVVAVDLVAVGAGFEPEDLGREIARLTLELRGGRARELPLRLSGSLYSYETELRRPWPPAKYLYAGRQRDRDALYVLRVPSHRWRASLRALRLERTTTRPGSQIAVLAISIERPGRRRR
jgi:hypothetical protein